MPKDHKNTAIYVANEDNPPYDPARPEKSLLKAILISALNDIKKNGDVKRQAEEFFLNQDEEYVFSFRSICSYLSVDPGKVLMLTGLTGERDEQPVRKLDSLIVK